MTTQHKASSSPERELAPLESGGLGAEEFKGAFRNHAAGVAVITADIGEGPVGLTATSVFSVSAEPALLVFSLSDLSTSTPTIQQADTVVVHLLGAEQHELARLCATSGIDRFADTAIWSRLPTGEPYFPGVNAWVRGRVINQLEAGTSVLIVVHALEAGSSGSGGHGADPGESYPLVYHNRTWHRLSEDSKID
ncbi:MAG: flavin oxidoreductase [Micrococcales bacterium 73-13]|nr:MAG: flavin oxidoreductase [Micrococcales bacterium 73-13]